MIARYLNMNDPYNRLRGRPKVRQYPGHPALVACWRGKWSGPAFRKEGGYLRRCMKCLRYAFGSGENEVWVQALIPDCASGRLEISHGYCPHCAEQEVRASRQRKAQRLAAKLVTVVLV